MDVIKYKDVEYPAYQASGFAARFAFPYAQEVCKGRGYDIGCSRGEWAFPGSIPIDKSIGGCWSAEYLPYDNVDYIFSSHCLEHISDWVSTVKYWTKMLRCGGTLFLYLPHYKQEYWRPWNNAKHRHVFAAETIYDFMAAIGYTHIFCSGRDLNHSFMIHGEKFCE
jgi:SAM-dependent methyltransferase